MLSALVFFGYMFVFSYAVKTAYRSLHLSPHQVITGFVGFISTFFFIRTIYGSIKVD